MECRGSLGKGHKRATKRLYYTMVYIGIPHFCATKFESIEAQNISATILCSFEFYHLSPVHIPQDGLNQEHTKNNPQTCWWNAWLWDGDRSALANSPRCNFDCAPTIFVHSFTALRLRRSDPKPKCRPCRHLSSFPTEVRLKWQTRASNWFGSAKLLTYGICSADLTLASDAWRSPTCLEERYCEDTLTFQRQPCNKLIWVVVTSSTVAICFASWDRSQSHTIAILGRDCSPPSPVPAHKLASKQASKQANKQTSKHVK